MPNTKIKKTKSYTLYMIHIPIVIIAAVAMFGSFLLTQGTGQILKEQGAVLPSKSVNNGKSSNSNKSDTKGNSGVAKADTTKGNPSSEKNTNPNKPLKADFVAPKGQNAPEYKQNMKKVVTELQGVALVEDSVGNEDVSDEIEDVATEENEDTDDVTDAIEQVESRGKFQTLLFGSDYKNLGQLRSQLVQNRNSIRKLTKNAGETVANGSGETVEQQLQTMIQERERIKAVIEENEGGFSLLGWVSRFLNGYEMTPINDADEEELMDEVDEVIGDDTSPSDEMDIGDTEPADEMEVGDTTEPTSEVGLE